MKWIEGGYRFDLDDHTARHEQIETKRTVQPRALVIYRQNKLPIEGYIS